MKTTTKTDTMTPVQEATIMRAATTVWQYIGADALEGRRSLSRAEVIELVLDADRLWDELRRGRTPVDPDLLEAVRRYDPAILKVVRKAFPATRYGW